MNEIIVKFCIGILILLFSTQKFVGLAKHISYIFRISPLIVGITVVAIGTSLPELAVSLAAVSRQDAGLAMGNIIGSNIVNILLVFPIGLFIGKLRIGTTKTQRNALILFVVTIVFYLSQILEVIKPKAGLILIGLAVIISLTEYTFGIFGRKHEDMKRLKNYKKEKFGFHTVLFGLILVVGIILGSILLVDAVEEISLITGISTTILGLTLTAVATSLPELLTTIFSQGEKEEKLTLGNILGSNIYNLLLVGGLTSLFLLDSHIPTKEWAWLLSTTAGFVLILKYYSGHKPPKVVGVLLLIILAAYFISQ